MTVRCQAAFDLQAPPQPLLTQHESLCTLTTAQVCSALNLEPHPQSDLLLAECQVVALAGCA